ncbi:MAG: hypothetical protein KGO82_07870 [Bacteroidota bacterium]|nr:hypothetical protein [Bacteroidota bacterium]
MRIRGVTYDTGFINNGVTTKELFDETTIAREMEIIKDHLHCNAVRITGGDADRLEKTAILAASAGLEVWYCPFTCDLDIQELQNFLLDAATRAEKIRASGASIVFLTGSEISLTTKGFFSGDSFNDRVASLKDPLQLRTKMPSMRAAIADFFNRTIPLIRERFHGKISYASLPFESVDWSLFDIIATDGAYKTAANAAIYEQAMINFASQGKPAAITEFGCGSYERAAANAGQGIWMVEWKDGRPIQLKEPLKRDEGEQVRYMLESLETFQKANMDAVFLTCFASYHLPFREDPLLDLDMTSYGIVKVYDDRQGLRFPDMRWDPKESFDAVASAFKNLE